MGRTKRKRLDDDTESEIFLQRCLKAKHRTAAEAAGVSTRTYHLRRVDEHVVELFQRLLARKRIAVLPLSNTGSEEIGLK